MKEWVDIWITAPGSEFVAVLRSSGISSISVLLDKQFCPVHGVTSLIVNNSDDFFKSSKPWLI